MAAMIHRKRLLLTCVYVIFPTTLIVLMLLGWMVSAENATVVLQSANSPDGRYRAEVVREDPGVSSGYEYMVRVMPAGLATFTRSLHALPFVPIYVALDVHREPDKLAVAWRGENEVTIHCEGCAGTTPGQERWREIALRYELR
jgi:hypothetical protein